MLSLQKLVHAVLVIIVLAAVIGLLLCLVNYLQLPDPFAWIAKGVLAVGGVFALIGVLMDLIGYPLFRFKE
jgi:hypothetical protein